MIELALMLTLLPGRIRGKILSRIICEPLTATADMAVQPGVLGCSFGFAQDRLPLRRTFPVRLGCKSLRLPGGTPIFTVS
jgi:hypothetical protein